MEKRVTQLQRLTVHARRAIAFAQQEAKQLDHHYIGTEHLLLGLLDEKDGKAALVLMRFHVDADTVRQRIQQRLLQGKGDAQRYVTFALGGLGELTFSYSKVVGRKRRLSDRRPLTERARKCMHFAAQEAHLLHAEQLGTEHLLLGIVIENKGLACVILRDMGVDIAQLKALALSA